MTADAPGTRGYQQDSDADSRRITPTSDEPNVVTHYEKARDWLVAASPDAIEVAQVHATLAVAEALASVVALMSDGPHAPSKGEASDG